MAGERRQQALPVTPTAIILQTDGSLCAMGANNCGKPGIGRTNDDPTLSLVQSFMGTAVGAGSHHGFTPQNRRPSLVCQQATAV